jgi:hypothetical protein
MDKDWGWQEQEDEGIAGRKHSPHEAGEDRPHRAVNEHHPYFCAFCGEDNEVFVDASGASHQEFTEDCSVCCRPNLISITIEPNGFVSIEVTQEYEA